jgi:patatin-like phospholipase/acyl hydrolase
MSASQWNSENKFYGLALTGGGFRGLFTARILEKIEEAYGQPIGRCFDLLSGTSIGGIVALAVAFEVPMAEVVRVFQSHGEYIFPRKRPPLGFGWLDFLVHLAVPKYYSAPLKNAIVSLIPEHSLLGDAKHAVLIPAMNVTKGKLEVFKTRHHERWTRDSAYRVVDIALATSAAPTYFELAKLNGSHYADGGLFANAPDQIIVHEAQNFLGVSDADLNLLSIGTTTSSYAIAKNEGRNFGVAKWQKNGRLFSSIISAQQQFVHQVMTHRYPGYLRLDYPHPPDSEYELGLDSASFSVQQLLLELADEVAKRALSSGQLDSLFKNSPKLKII